MRIVTLRRQFLAAAAASVLPSLRAESLQLRLRGNILSISAGQWDILTGAVLSRLKSGASVPFDFHLSLWTGSRSNLLRRAFERFMVSYDLWEEKFSVTGLRNPRPSASNLAASSVVGWCLDHIALAPVDITDDKQLWVRLDVRAAEPKEDTGALLDESGLRLSYLIDLLSRPDRKDPNRWALETGPVRAGAIRAAPAAEPKLR